MTRERKIYAAIAVVAFSALFVDRVLLRSGGTAPAAAGASEVRTILDELSLDLPESDLPGQAQPTSSDELAARIEQVSQRHPMNLRRISDAFRPSDRWDRESGRAAADRPPNVVETFRRQANLTAVMGRGERAVVVVNEQFVTPGEQIDGFTLTEVSEQSATFVRGDDRVTLALHVSL